MSVTLETPSRWIYSNAQIADLVMVPEELALGKMAEVEKSLEDK